ncbi:carbohydrate kinase family protein [Phenylobacterium sp.]|uniref:carbohydrate kinase family protein n=1 Tax=Phenylobacterium sp. TaxID=1871053 RepID=UPI0025DE55FF|nr:carbohydrate kinase family protein [Phenylobacterium sp.]
MTTGLLAIGLTTLDINAYPIDALTHTERASLIKGLACAPAGTAAGAALVAAKLGVRTALAGAVGDDMNGLFVRTGLESLGVDTRLLATRAGEPTSSTLLAVESDGRRSSFHRPGAGLSPPLDAAVVAAARGSRFVHYAAVGGPTTDGGPGAALLAEAKAAGAVVTCDLISPRGSAAEEIGRILPHVDYFMPSAAEAVLLSGSEDLAAAAERFVALGAGACVIKNGRAGVVALIDGRRHAVPAFAVDAVDTTSCGDSFCAGFIAALDRGWGPLEACRFAAMVAGLVAEGVGTLGALASFDATVTAMGRYAVAS